MQHLVSNCFWTRATYRWRKRTVWTCKTCNKSFELILISTTVQTKELNSRGASNFQMCLQMNPWLLVEWVQNWKKEHVENTLKDRSAKSKFFHQDWQRTKHNHVKPQENVESSCYLKNLRKVESTFPSSNNNQNIANDRVIKLLS